DITIINRTNSQSSAIEEEIRYYRILYKIIGVMKIYDSMEIKDLIFYLRLRVTDNDFVSFMLILYIPSCYLVHVTSEEIINYAHEHNISLMKAAQEICDHKALNAGSTKKLQTFINIVQYLRVQCQEQGPSEFLKFMIDHLQFVEYLKFEKPEDHQQRVDN